MTVCAKACWRERGALARLELRVPDESGKVGGARSGRISVRKDLGNRGLPGLLLGAPVSPSSAREGGVEEPAGGQTPPWTGTTCPVNRSEKCEKPGCQELEVAQTQSKFHHCTASVSPSGPQGRLPEVV